MIGGDHLAPGDTVLMASGTYVTPDDVLLDIAHVGTPGQPITIRAAPGARPVLTRNTFGAHDDFYQNLQHNVVNMRGAQHVVLDGLEITGGNWGVRIGSKTNGQNPGPLQPMGDVVRPAHHITIRNCHIHHTHNTAVSANFPGDVYDSLVFVNNEIDHIGRYGEAFYLGSWSAADGTRGIVRNSLVANNHIHDNVWVGSWYQDPQGPGYHGTAIQLKDGCYGNRILDNVMHYTRYPAVLISGAQSSFGRAGDPGWAPNLVEGNVVWQVSQAPGDITGQGMQIAADAIVCANVVYAPQPFYNSDHQCEAGNLVLSGNTFVSSTAAAKQTLEIKDVPAAPILIANNALYRAPGNTAVISGAGSASGLVHQVGNVAMLDLAQCLGDPAALDFFPPPRSPLIGAADPSWAGPVDFNGTPRAGDATAGAYVFDPAGNPGWAIGSGFKPAETWSAAAASAARVAPLPASPLAPPP